MLFTSFERYLPLPRVLDKIGQVFGKSLEEQGIHWLTLDDNQRRDLALQVLKQIPVLWIWDNIEPVAGFPIGTESAWNAQEQKDLVDFLREARDTEAKFLLTSRRDEMEWLGNLPRRITVPPMPMLERVELARAIADKQGHRTVDVESWKSLLRYTQGNPLTITVLVGQVLQEGLTTKDQIKEFVNQLRSGERDIDDDESQGRSKSLGASLKYGSESAFNEDERRVLALLSFFQGFVDVGVLSAMGQGSFSLEELRGLDRDEGTKLLDRVAEVGMLTALGGGYYRIHPALPWFFRGIFQQYYAGREDEAARAFVEIVSGLGNFLNEQYQIGNREVISIMNAEEANLLYARQLALEKGWWNAIINTMGGLRWLYDQTGRWVEWRHFIEEIVPFFMDPKTDGPIQGREENWNIVINYRVKLAIQARQWDEALKLQEKHVEWEREKAKLALGVDPREIDEETRILVRNYIVSMGDLAEIQMGKGDEGCIQSYKAAIEICEKYGFMSIASAYSMNLGNAYIDIDKIYDLDEAERWFMRGLDLTPEQDGLERGRCLGSLGSTTLRRFEDTRKDGKPDLKYLEAAQEFYQKALKAFPQNAINELSTTYNWLGNVYRYAGMTDEAMKHYQEAIYLGDSLSDIYWAAQYRLNAAYTLMDADRLSDALEYARSAQERFEACGAAGVNKVKETRDLISRIEDMRSQPN